MVNVLSHVQYKTVRPSMPIHTKGSILMQPIHHRGSPPAAEEKEAVDPPIHPRSHKENVFFL